MRWTRARERFLEENCRKGAAWCAHELRRHGIPVTAGAVQRKGSRMGLSFRRRAECAECHAMHTKLRRDGLCPSCHARRMREKAEREYEDAVRNTAIAEKRAASEKRAYDAKRKAKSDLLIRADSVNLSRNMSNPRSER